MQEFVAAKKGANVIQTDTLMNASTLKTSANQSAHLRISTTPAVFGPRCAPREQTPHNKIVQRVAILEDAAAVILRKGTRQTTQHHANLHTQRHYVKWAEQDGQEPKQIGTTTEKKTTSKTNPTNNLYDKLALTRTPHDGIVHPLREAVFWKSRKQDLTECDGARTSLANLSFTKA